MNALKMIKGLMLSYVVMLDLSPLSLSINKYIHFGATWVREIEILANFCGKLSAALKTPEVVMSWKISRSDYAAFPRANPVRNCVFSHMYCY